jgi:hypothetical protein
MKPDIYTVEQEKSWPTYWNIKIKQLSGYGVLECVSDPISIDVFIDPENKIAHCSYDFGMTVKIPIEKEKNYHYNYTGDNPESDPFKTAFSSIKFDLMHAFNHYNGDPNYTEVHWALFGNLKDRVKAYFPEDEVPTRNPQTEFNFDSL